MNLITITKGDLCKVCQKKYNMPHNWCCLYECREHEFCSGCNNECYDEERCDKKCLSKIIKSQSESVTITSEVSDILNTMYLGEKTLDLFLLFDIDSIKIDDYDMREVVKTLTSL